jgi:hypothetical protein
MDGFLNIHQAARAVKARAQATKADSWVVVHAGQSSRAAALVLVVQAGKSCKANCMLRPEIHACLAYMNIS